MSKRIYVTIVAAIILYGHLAAACNKTSSLFTIERSTNGNVVHYDACLANESELSASDPVEVYWIMESGLRESLTWMGARYAYGVRSPEKLGDGSVEFSLAAFGRKMLVTKIDGTYRAVVFVNGQRCILERVYVECQPGLLGVPRVLYADFSGQALDTGASIVERVSGKRSS